jgi:hypothetical protein
MDKQRVKQTMLDLEQHQFDASREAYLRYVSSARLDPSEPIRVDEQAQAEFARDLSEAFDQPIHAHADKIAHLQRIDFGPKDRVEEGAIVTIMGRSFVIAVATDRFDCDGTELIGVSVQAPLFRAIEGKTAGESCTFNARHFTLERVL